MLRRQLEVIQADPRFDADYTIEEVRSLPGRLEESQRGARSRGPLIWIVLALVIALVGVLLLARPPA